MKRFSVEYHLDVRTDIQSAIAWYYQQSEGLDRRFASSVKNGIQRIIKNPEQYQKRYKDIRILFIDVSLMAFITT